MGKIEGNHLLSTTMKLSELHSHGEEEKGMENWDIYLKEAKLSKVNQKRLVHSKA